MPLIVHFLPLILSLLVFPSKAFACPCDSGAQNCATHSLTIGEERTERDRGYLSPSITISYYSTVTGDAGATVCINCDLATVSGLVGQQITRTTGSVSSIEAVEKGGIEGERIVTGVRMVECKESEIDSILSSYGAGDGGSWRIYVSRECESGNDVNTLLFNSATVFNTYIGDYILDCDGIYAGEDDTCDATKASSETYPSSSEAMETAKRLSLEGIKAEKRDTFHIAPGYASIYSYGLYGNGILEKLHLSGPSLSLSYGLREGLSTGVMVMGTTFEDTVFHGSTILSENRSSSVRVSGALELIGDFGKSTLTSGIGAFAFISSPDSTGRIFLASGVTARVRAEKETERMRIGALLQGYAGLWDNTREKSISAFPLISSCWFGWSAALTLGFTL